MYALTAVALLATLASAKNCKNLTIPIVATARNGVFDIAAPAHNYDVTNFILDLTQPGKNFSASVLKGYKTVSGHYNISATYCEPHGGQSPITQIMTHGIGVDKAYWDFPFNNYNYSYVNKALSEGYNTFTYDRLGIGQSSHGDPINEIQAPLEIDALRYLSEGLRHGTLKGVPKQYSLIHVGHSFGSQQTFALTQMYPNISDGIVLTGWSQSMAFAATFAYGANFVKANTLKKFPHLPDGYIAAKDPRAVQIDFFAPGDFDPKILLAAYDGEYPETYGEELTSAAIGGGKNEFPNPVYIVTGERDLPFCGGDCQPMGKSVLAPIKKNFPKASSYKAQIIPGAGHGLNLQYSAAETYDAIFNFLTAAGLAPHMKPTPPKTAKSASTATPTSGSSKREIHWDS